MLIDLDFGAAVLGDEHLVTLLDGESDELAIVITLAGAEGDDFTFLRFLFVGVWDDNPALFGF